MKREELLDKEGEVDEYYSNGIWINMKRMLTSTHLEQRVEAGSESQ